MEGKEEVVAQVSMVSQEGTSGEIGWGARMLTEGNVGRVGRERGGELSGAWGRIRHGFDGIGDKVPRNVTIRNALFDCYRTFPEGEIHGLSPAPASR